MTRTIFTIFNEDSEDPIVAFVNVIEHASTPSHILSSTNITWTN